MRVRVANLTDQHDLDMVRALRDGSPGYARLKRTMESLFHGKRCVVIGSAPELGDVRREPGDVVVCVNGSFHNAERLGIARPDAIFMTSYIFTKGNRVAQKTFELLRGRQFERCIMVTGTMALSDCVQGMGEAGAVYRAIEEITGHERAAIVGDVCGIELGMGRLEERVSTGVTTAICALWGGAREVHLAGFSLAGGHSYMNYRSRRYHRKPDSIFFALCRRNGLAVSTAARDLQQEFGIPAAI